MSQNSDASNNSGPSNPDTRPQPPSDVQQPSEGTSQQPSSPYNSAQPDVQQPSSETSQQPSSPYNSGRPDDSQPPPGTLQQPSSPYNFAWPGTQQPPPGTLQQPSSPYNFAPPRSRKKPLLLIFAIGALALMVVLALVISTVVALRSISNSSNVAASQLSIAATHLSSASGTHYVGTITNPNGDKIQVDLEVTNNGSTHGTLTQGSDQLEVLVVDNKTFLKADELFWSKHGAPQNQIGEYAKQWVKVSSDVIGIDIQKVLAPVTLGQQLSQTAKSHQATLGPETIINGVQTREVITPQGTLYITTTAPQRIVRIEGTTALTPDNSGQTNTKALSALSEGMATNSDPGAYQFDLSNLSDDQIENLYEQLQQKVQDLTNSVDGNVQFKLNGDGVLAPCDDFGCTATLTISNTVTLTNPDLNVDQPITVSITVNFTLDGISVGGCPPISKTMPPNGETTVECSVTYSADTTTTHEVLATWTAFAQALVAADIQRITSDLQQQQTDLAQQEATQFKTDDAEKTAKGRIPINNLDDLNKARANAPPRDNPPPGVKADDPLWNKYVDYRDGRFEELETAFKNNPNTRPQVKPPLTWDAYEKFMRQVLAGREFQLKVTPQLIAEAKQAGDDVDIQQDVEIEKNGNRWRPDQLVVSKETLNALANGGKPTDITVETYSDKSRDFGNLSDPVLPKEVQTQIEEDIQELFDKYSGEFVVKRSQNQKFDEETGKFFIDGSKYPLFECTVKANKVTLVYDAKYVPDTTNQEKIELFANKVADKLNPAGQEISFEVLFRSGIDQPPTE